MVRELDEAATTGSLADDPRWTFVTARILEEGDRDDLRWLFSRRSEANVCAWFEQHSGRTLSRRSRWFWARILLASTASEAPTASRQLWPLA